MCTGSRAHGERSVLWTLLNSKCYSLTLRSIPYFFNYSQTLAFSVLSNLWNVTYIPQTPFLLSTWWHVFIPAFCLLRRVRNGTERRHTSKIIDSYRHTYSRQASIAFLKQTLKHVLICHLCFEFFFPVFFLLLTFSVCGIQKKNLIV